MRQEKHPTRTVATSGRVAFAVTAALTLGAGLAHADIITPASNGGTLQLSQSFASTAAGQTPTTVVGTGANDGIGNVTGSNLTGNGNSTYLFGQSFSNSVGSYAAGTLSNGDTFGLVASYVVALPTSTTGSYIFSLNLSSSTGIDDLSARLYSYGPGVNTTLGNTGALPNGGLVSSWSASFNGGLVDSTTMSPTNVTAGLYVLEVVGQLSNGATSGSYSGQLSVDPVVPLPAAFPLLLSGIAGMFGFGRRRKAATAVNAAFA
jgi:hypothetical protein